MEVTTGHTSLDLKGINFTDTPGPDTLVLTLKVKTSKVVKKIVTPQTLFPLALCSGKGAATS